MGSWLQEGLLLDTAVFPRLSASPRVRKGTVPAPAPQGRISHTGPQHGSNLRRQARGQPFREDGGFLRKRMQMREERDLLIHVMSVELSMTN